VVIMTGHDAARVRGRDVNLPRDNVIFELGLFLGRLGRKRTFFMVDKNSGTKIASDLSGVEPVEFESRGCRKGRGRFLLGKQAAKLKRQMLPLGVRYKPSPDTQSKQAVLWRYSSGMAGFWWERMRRGDDNKSALSHVLIEVDEMTNMLRMQGLAYDRKGRPLAEWATLTSSVLLGARPRLFYQWEGEHDAAHGQVYGGGGVILFESGDSGHGYFYDTNFAMIRQGAQTRVKRFRMYRCSAREIAIMSTPWTAEAELLIRRKLRELKG
jgi:hypothetical protein